MLPDNVGSLVQSQASTETARRLQQITGLKSVHVAPVESIQWSGWPQDATEYFGEPFNSLLGRFAAAVISRDLAITRKLNWFDGEGGVLPEPPPLRVGVAGGSTIYALVEAFQLPREVPVGRCEVTPLVVGPIPETNYSAGFNAEILRKKVPSNVNPRPITNIKSVAAGFEITVRPDVIANRDAQPSNDWGNVLNLDYVVTGLGSRDSGQLRAHLGLMYEMQHKPVPQGLIGDICSRLFGQDANEIDADIGNRFVAISFGWLKYLSSQPGRRIYAVAGGKDKVLPLKALLRLSTKDLLEERNAQRRDLAPKRVQKIHSRLFNVLITDELTANKLVRELEKELKSYENDVKSSVAAARSANR